jgi:hypothetical protein
MAVFLALFAIASLFFNFFLSVERTKVVYFSVLAAVFQIIAITVWHEDILQVIMISVYTISCFLLALVLYYIYYTKYEKKVVSDK